MPHPACLDYGQLRLSTRWQDRTEKEECYQLGGGHHSWLMGGRCCRPSSWRRGCAGEQAISDPAVELATLGNEDRCFFWSCRRPLLLNASMNFRRFSTCKKTLTLRIADHLHSRPGFMKGLFKTLGLS